MKPKQTAQAPSAELAYIMQEVKQHGFYATHLDTFLPEIKSIEERIYIMRIIASKAHLVARSNLEQNLCLLEQG